ncbi:hypothetical protein [Sphingobium sp. CR28]|uniref:hypothetical protein n=1 Tax=Sphingobium sp. CR28 TaxID=3400272 RepID=UPI003FEFAFE7
MASDRRTFYCLPRRAICDGELSALDHRVLGAIAIHDGMSASKGKGAGCVASNKTLTAMVGCDYTSMSKTIGRLLRKGYVVREPQLLDKRKFTLRLIYDEPDAVRSGPTDSWSNGQQISDEVVGEIANDPPEIVGEDANEGPEIVGRDNFETRTNLPETTAHYIPLRGEIDFAKQGNRFSKAARLSSRDATSSLKKLISEGLPEGALISTLSQIARQAKKVPITDPALIDALTDCMVSEEIQTPALGMIGRILDKHVEDEAHHQWLRQRGYTDEYLRQVQATRAESAKPGSSRSPIARSVNRAADPFDLGVVSTFDSDLTGRREPLR